MSSVFPATAASVFVAMAILWIVSLLRLNASIGDIAWGPPLAI